MTTVERSTLSGCDVTCRVSVRSRDEIEKPQDGGPGQLQPLVVCNSPLVQPFSGRANRNCFPAIAITNSRLTSRLSSRCSSRRAPSGFASSQMNVPSGNAHHVDDSSSERTPSLSGRSLRRRSGEATWTFPASLPSPAPPWVRDNSCVLMADTAADAATSFAPALVRRRLVT